jgi:hypothetical protein
LERVRQTVRDFAAELSPDSYQLIFHQYGRNGVMAEREPLQHVVSHEVGIIGEVAAPTQAIADALCNRARVALMHLSYPGQMATAGNEGHPASVAPWFDRRASRVRGVYRVCSVTPL